jgi:hypothetical protein
MKFLIGLAFIVLTANIASAEPLLNLLSFYQAAGVAAHSTFRGSSERGSSIDPFAVPAGGPAEIDVLLHRRLSGVTALVPFEIHPLAPGCADEDPCPASPPPALPTIPEPATLLTLGLGLLAAGRLAVRKRQSRP